MIYLSINESLTITQKEVMAGACMPFYWAEAIQAGKP